MSRQSFRVPRYGHAGVAFLGVEMKDTKLLLASFFLGLIIGGPLGGDTMGYIGVPVIGFWLNKQYLAWKGNQLPGYLKSALFEMGLTGYSNAFAFKKIRYIGDSNIANLASSRMLTAIQRTMRKTK